LTRLPLLVYKKESFVIEYQNRLKSFYKYEMNRKGSTGPQPLKKISPKKPGDDHTRSMPGPDFGQPGDELYRILAEAAHDLIFIVDRRGILGYVNSFAAKQVGSQPKKMVGKPVSELFSPDVLAGADNNFKKVFTTGQPVYTEGQVVFNEKAVWLGTWLVPFQDGSGQVSSIMGVSRDITQQRQIEDALRHRTEEMTALQATVLDLAVQQDLFSLLRTIIERSMTLLKAPSGFIYLYQSATDDLELVAELGYSLTPGVRLKLGEGMAGRVAQTRKTLIVDDYATWEGRSPVFKNNPYHGVVEAPMLFGGQLIGVLGVNDTSEKQCTFTEEDARLLLLFAGQAASAVHEARLVEDLKSELAERKQAEVLLSSAETRHRALVEQIPAIVYTDSAQQPGQTSYISPQIRTVLGYDPQEWSLNNDLWIKAMHPDDRERVLAEYNRTFQSGESFTVEYRMMSSQGKMLWIQDEAILIRDQSGSPLFWQGFMLDITERKQAEGALKESEEHYRRLFDLSPDAIAVHSAGRIALVNKAALDLMGAKHPEELIGKPMMDFVHPDFRPLVIERTRQQIVQGSVVPSIEEKFIRLDGTTVDVDVTAAPIHYQDTPASLVIIRDIAERKRAQALQEAVFRIAVAAEKTKSLEDLYPQIHEIVSSVMPAENFYITLYDEAQDLLHFSYVKDAQDEPYLGEIQPGQGLTAYVLRTGKSLLCTQAVHNELERQGAVKLLGVPSAIWLGVPLVIEGKTIGAMVVQHYTDPSAYTERDQHMLEFVSTQVAIAITRKQAEKALETSEAELRALFAAMTEVVIVYDREGRYREIAPTDPGLLIQSPNQLIGKSIYDFFPKNDADRLFQNIQTVLNMGIKMETEYSLKIGEYDRWFACTISPLQTDTVLWVAHDITNRIQAEKVQEAIYGISQAAISTESIDELYVSIHTTLAELIHVENFFIALYDPSSDLISFPYYVDQYDEPPPANKPGRGLTEYVMRTMQPLLAPRSVFDELILRGEIESVGTVSVDWLGVPLMVEGQVIGVMVTQSYHENIHFNQEDLRLFEFVSTQVAQMIDRKRVEEKIRYLGIHDSLTNLYNRAYFDEEMKRLDNGRQFPVSVLMADIDDLKGINDQEGHATGDECLRLAAQALKAAFRTEDVVARIGGDEFAALLPGIDARMAGKAKQRIIDNIKKQNAKRKGKSLQISMGVSTAEKIGSLVEALRLADDQMYLEKQSKEVAAHR